MNVKDAYIILYKDDSWKGPALPIYLRNGGKANISETHAVHDETSSFKLWAPSNVSVQLCENHTYDNWPGEAHRWRGNNSLKEVNKGELKAHGVHDNISSVAWYVDGRLYNDRIDTV